MKPNNLVVFYLVFFYSALNTHAQERFPTMASPKIENKLCETIQNETEDMEVRRLIDTILQRMHLRNTIRIISCSDLIGCSATINEKELKPYILYNNDFLNGVKLLNFTETSLPNKQDDWEALFILAHELGHIYNFHFGLRSPGKTLIDLELEADEFAGSMLRSIGANLEQTQKVMYREYISETDGDTHPSRQRRLNAVKLGWEKAGNPFAKNEEERAEVKIKDSLLRADRHYIESNDKQAMVTYLNFTDSEYFTPSRQTNLGLGYFRGSINGSPDYKEAYKWLEKASKGGDDRAQLYLGLMYIKKYGLELDDSAAQRWFKESASKGNTNAMLALCITDSLENEIKWIQEAANLGNSTAQALLGHKYLHGLDGLPKDSSLGLEYLQKAIERQNALGYIYYGRALSQKATGKIKDSIINEYLEPGAICLMKNKNLFVLDDSTRKTDESEFVNLLYFNSTTVDDFVWAAQDLADYYEGDQVSMENMTTVLEWKEVMANYGDSQVAYMLGELYETGKSESFVAKKNYTKAKKMYELAAEKNHAKAKKALERFND